MIHEGSTARELEQALEIQLERTTAAEEAFQSVTRVKVLHNRKYTEHWADHWRVYVQDGGRTIALLATGDGAGAVAERAAGLGGWVGIPASAAQEYAQAVAEADGQPDRFDQSRESTEAIVAPSDLRCGDELVGLQKAGLADAVSPCSDVVEVEVGEHPVVGGECIRFRRREGDPSGYERTLWNGTGYFDHSLFHIRRPLR